MEGGAFSNLLASGAADGDASRLATQLTAGATVWRRLLDFHIDSFYDGGCGALQPTVRVVLRIALFEILILKCAHHAASHQAVELVRAGGKPAAAGLVNAVVRKACRAAAAGALPPPPSPAVACSFPDWIAHRWTARFGSDEAIALMRASNRVASFGIRPTATFSPLPPPSPNPNLPPLSPLDALAAACEALGVATSPSVLLPNKLLSVSAALFPLRPLLSSGAIALQDESASLVVLLLRLRPGMRVADVCAAPGGKALFAASLGADVTAVDESPPRMRMLTVAAAAQGVSARVSGVVGTAEHFCSDAQSAAAFDSVLLDAPCTGLGVLSKRSDLRWRRVLADVGAAAVRAPSPLSRL